jgi:hypothetical protein
MTILSELGENRRNIFRCNLWHNFNCTLDNNSYEDIYNETFLKCRTSVNLDQFSRCQILHFNIFLSHRRRSLKYCTSFLICCDEEWRIGETARGAELAIFTSEFSNEGRPDLKQICDLC